MILSSILGENEKVEQHIRKKTHKPNELRFWVEGGVIPLCGAHVSFLFDLSDVFPRFFQQVISKPMVCGDDWLRQVQFDPCIESLPDGGFRQACPV